MKFLLFLSLAAFYCAVESKYTPPKVQVYSRDPGEFGKANTLICHVSNFHPPAISIQLMKDGVEIPDALQTDLAFKKNWHFHLTRNVAFTPQDGTKYTCKVTHGEKAAVDYIWESKM
ncbi:beta-2-microglobulin isoform X2 [Acanthochromis polyacanthus]|uniref:beta-2-microglobulin isoform X2 n=1 Tax=Acanthochromis polyacanthus TaxID=80966 RepID=UPI00223494B2|nr:beta-2-microglobulin isoform X2 [Acanthochromis polyacanthus]